MNPSALRTVKVMRRARIRRWALRTFAAAFAALIYAVGYFTPRPMTLPKVGDPVIVYTKTRVHIGWMDENGAFRSIENGLPLNQVTQWKRP